jgi:hypothetical protein
MIDKNGHFKEGVHEYNYGFSVILLYSFAMILSHVCHVAWNQDSRKMPKSETGITFCHVMP